MGVDVKIAVDKETGEVDMEAIPELVDEDAFERELLEKKMRLVDPRASLSIDPEEVTDAEALQRMVADGHDDAAVAHGGLFTRNAAH